MLCQTSGGIVSAGVLAYEFNEHGAVDRMELAHYVVLPAARGVGAGRPILTILLQAVYRRRDEYG